MLLSFSKILVMLVLIQCVTSVEFYKSKRVPPSYKRARTLKNKTDNANIKLAKTLVSENIDKENVSIGSTETTEVENISLITTTEKPNVPSLNLEAPVLETKRDLKKKRKVLVQKRRLESKRKTDIIKDVTQVDILPETTTEAYEQKEIATTPTTTEINKQKEIATTQTTAGDSKQEEIATTQPTTEVYKQKEITTTQPTTALYKQKETATTPHITAVYKQKEITATQTNTRVYKRKEKAATQTATEASKQKQRAATQTTTEVYKRKEQAAAQTTTEAYKQSQRATTQTTTEVYKRREQAATQTTTEAYKQRQRATTQTTTEIYKPKQKATTQATTEVYIPKKTTVTQTTKYQRNYDYSTIPYTTFEKSTEKPFVPIIGSENYVYASHGDYHYSYEGGDGTKAFERGELRPVDDISGQPGVVGGYSYKDEDGNDYSLTYTAGKDGYRPVGAHLPTPPPIPPAIQRVLRILATKTTPEPVTERISRNHRN